METQVFIADAPHGPIFSQALKERGFGKRELHVFHEPVVWATALPAKILEEPPVEIVSKRPTREGKNGHIPRDAKDLLDDLLPIVNRDMLQDVGCDYGLERPRGKRKVGSRADDRQHTSDGPAGKFQVAAHNALLIKVSKPIGSRAYLKNGCAVGDGLPQFPDYWEISHCPVDHPKIKRLTVNLSSVFPGNCCPSEETSKTHGQGTNG
jgi:hypothetical protein